VTPTQEYCTRIS